MQAHWNFFSLTFGGIEQASSPRGKLSLPYASQSGRPVRRGILENGLKKVGRFFFRLFKEYCPIAPISATVFTKRCGLKGLTSVYITGLTSAFGEWKKGTLSCLTPPPKYL